MPAPETKARRRAVLRDAKAYVRGHYRDPDMSLLEVAKAVHVSPRQLQRVFREEGDGDFRDFLLRVRMERARQLLTDKRNPLSIRTTAPRVGYRQASGLRQAFNRYFGLNPSEVQPRTPDYLGAVTWSEDEPSQGT